MKRQIRFTYNYATTLRKFARSDAFLRGLMGPFGSGKSSACVIEILRRGMAQKPSPDGIRRSRWAVIRNSMPQLRDTTIRTFMEWIPEEHFGRYYRTTHDYVITKIPGVHLEINFRALDRPEQVSNLLSAEYTGAWFNEVREIPWSLVDAMMGRVGRYPKASDVPGYWYGIIADTNPPDDLSAFYKYFEEDRPDNAEIFKQPSGLSDEAENIPFLQKNYYPNLAAGKSRDFVDAYVHGKYTFLTEGAPVFPEYNDSIHCQEVEATPGVKLHRGWDFGLTPSCVISQVKPDGTYAVLDELVSFNSGIEKFADEVLLFCAGKYPDYEWEDTGDPAGGQRAQTDERTCFAVMFGKGINVFPGVQTLAARLESVRKPLNTLVGGKPQFVVSARCKYVRRGLGGAYHYKRLLGKDGQYHETPEKNHYSHPIDALQYTCTRIFGDEVRGVAKNHVKPIKKRKWV